MATLNLAPAELGRLSIKMAMEEDSLRATVRVERPETLEVLKQHLPELRAALAGAGIEAQEFDLALGFDFGDSQGSGDKQSTPAGRRARSVTGGDEQGGALLRSLTNEVGVDTYA